MEAEKRQDHFRSFVGDEIGQALRGCQMSARGFFYELTPLLERSEPYGRTYMDTLELALHFKVSLHMVRRYIFELKAHNVLKEGSDGSLMCPMLIRRRFK